MYFSQEVLRPYLDEHLITEQRHPLDENMRIFNYTHRCQYDKGLWDEVTMNCRGLVLDVKREVVVSACLKKFFNYDEHLSNGWVIPNEKPVIMDKLDGWYGALMWLNDEPWIHTRGSFTSPGAQWATAWFRELFFGGMSRQRQTFWRRDDVTHIFEIIAPVTHIVVRYAFEGLVHLATIGKISDHNYWPLYTPEKYEEILTVGVIEADDYAALKNLNTDNAEGFVIFFPGAQQRLKIKFSSYLNLHRVITGLSAHALWEMWRDGQTLSDVAESVPEDMRPWVAKQFSRFNGPMVRMEVEATDTYADIMRHQLSRTWGKDKTKRDKEIALKFQEHGEMATLLFMIHKRRELLWNTVEPIGSETFKREDEA